MTTMTMTKVRLELTAPDGNMVKVEYENSDDRAPNIGSNMQYNRWYFKVLKCHYEETSPKTLVIKGALYVF